MKSLLGAVLLAASLALTGCAEIIIGIGGLVASGIGIYQRKEDRDTQKDTNTEIKGLREAVERHQAEVKRLNEQLLEGK